MSVLAAGKDKKAVGTSFVFRQKRYENVSRYCFSTYICTCWQTASYSGYALIVDSIEVALSAHFQFFPIYMSQNRRGINLKTCFIVFFCIFVLIYIEEEAIYITRMQQLSILLI